TECPHGNEVDQPGFTRELTDNKVCAEYVHFRAKQLGLSFTGVDRTKVQCPEMYYNRQSKDYWLQACDGDWQAVNKEAAADHLVAAGLSPLASEPGTLSEVARQLVNVRDQFGVDGVMTLAGYQAGLHEVNALNILVSKGFSLI